MHNVVNRRCSKLEPVLTTSALTRQHELIVATVATGDGPVKRHTEALPHVLLRRQLPRSRRDHSHVPAMRRRLCKCAYGGFTRWWQRKISSALVLLHLSHTVFAWL